jgi:hypothetical protein
MSLVATAGKLKATQALSPPFTLSLWYRLHVDASTSQSHSVCSLEHASSNVAQYVINNFTANVTGAKEVTTTFKGTHPSGGLGNIQADLTDVGLGAWHHYALVSRSLSDWELYRNGASIGTSTTELDSLSVGRVHIGGVDQGTPNTGFNDARVAEFAVWTSDQSSIISSLNGGDVPTDYPTDLLIYQSLFKSANSSHTGPTFNVLSGTVSYDTSLHPSVKHLISLKRGNVVLGTETFNNFSVATGTKDNFIDDGSLTISIGGTYYKATQNPTLRGPGVYKWSSRHLGSGSFVYKPGARKIQVVK